MFDNFENFSRPDNMPPHWIWVAIGTKVYSYMYESEKYGIGTIIEPYEEDGCLFYTVQWEDGTESVECDMDVELYAEQYNNLHKGKA